MKRIKIILMLFSSIFLTSCATVQTYEGEELPQEKVAVIKSDYWGNLVSTAVVRKVDGRSMGLDPGDIMVLPGKHVVKIRVAHSFGSLGAHIQHGTVVLHAEAGHTYKAGGAITSQDPWVWIVDEGTNTVVAGRRPKREAQAQTRDLPKMATYKNDKDIVSGRSQSSSIMHNQIRDGLEMITCRADDFPTGWHFKNYMENEAPPATPYKQNVVDYLGVRFGGSSLLDMGGCHLAVYKSVDAASEAVEWHKQDFAAAGTIVRQVAVGDYAMYSYSLHNMGNRPSHTYIIILRRNSAVVDIRIITPTAISPEEISQMLMKIDSRLPGLTNLKTH
jgi:hypothetical protein